MKGNRLLMPSWFWPQKHTTEASVAVRMGRVAHYILTIASFLSLVDALILIAVDDSYHAPEKIVIATLAFVAGRAVRYLFANE